MGERVKTVGGTMATRPIYDFMMADQGLGKTFYVHSGTGSDTANGRYARTAFATLAKAISMCTANQGDKIIVLPGHTETLASAGNIFSLSVAGISVVGYGTGALTPVFNLGHADATATISAPDCYLSTIKILSTAADVAVGLTMSATADNSVVDLCTFRDSGASLELLVGISVAAAAHGVKILSNSFRTTAAAGSTNAILSAAVTDLEVANNVAFGKYSAGAMLTSGVLTRATITDNILVNSEAAIALALSGTTSTGILARNFLGGTTSIAAALTGNDAMWSYDNKVSGAAGASGLLDPAADGD